MSNELYLKYAEVIEMCKGTKLEATPWVCVKYLDGTIKDHPLFRNTNERDFKFAIAVVEDKPVFVGDKVFIKDNRYPNINWENFKHWENGIKALSKDWTWQEPKKKFKLEEYEFPCPKGIYEFWSLPIKTLDRYFIIDDNNAFLFDTEEDAKLVKNTLIRIFKENLK